MTDIKNLLENEVIKRDCYDELCYEKPDPLFVARKYHDEYIALVCALFGYGNAKAIIVFLEKLDFALLDGDEKNIRKSLQGLYYRFQKEQDIIDFFVVLSSMKKEYSLQDIFLDGYMKNKSVLDGIDKIIHTICERLENYSEGMRFLIGTRPKRDQNGMIKYKGNSVYKRYNMFLRWMVRDDNLDMGLWKKVNKKDLLLPLDTHTFKVSQKLGLLSRKTYDLYAVYLVTERLKEFDKDDPIKYDFALYRLGQEKII
jgi:uncharacterized protein (TIGR02757 family)